MNRVKTHKLFLFMMFFLFTESLFAQAGFQPAIKQNFIESAKENTNWKIAYVTGKNGQIVFMNISPKTNPKNEIGEETHDFDQFIFVVEGKGRAILNGTAFLVKEGDLIFIPEGALHNVINQNQDQALKIISFYSENDMPAGRVYKTSKDQPSES